MRDVPRNPQKVGRLGFSVTTKEIPKRELRAPIENLYGVPLFDLMEVTTKEIPKRELRVGSQIHEFDHHPLTVTTKEIPKRELRDYFDEIYNLRGKDDLLQQKKSQKGN